MEEVDGLSLLLVGCVVMGIVNIWFLAQVEIMRSRRIMALVVDDMLCALSGVRDRRVPRLYLVNRTRYDVCCHAQQGWWVHLKEFAL